VNGADSHEADVAVRLRRPKEPALIARKLRVMHDVLATSSVSAVVSVAEPAKLAAMAHSRPPAEKTPAELLAAAIGLLLQDGENEGQVAKLRAARVLEAVAAALIAPDLPVTQALEKAAATIQLALNTKDTRSTNPTIAAHEHKGPVAELIRERLMEMFSSRATMALDRNDAATMAKALDVTARMVVGSDRIFKKDEYEARVERWTKAISALFVNTRFKDDELEKRCTEVIEACARADGYERPASLFRGG